MKLLLFTVYLICSLSLTKAQDFWEKTTGPYGGEISSLAYNPANGWLYAACSYKGFFVSKDRGNNWIRIKLQPNFFSMTSIAIKSDSIIFGASMAGLIESRDYGLNWFKATRAGSDVLSSISVQKDGSLLVGDVNFFVYKSTDDGVTWSNLNKTIKETNVSSLFVNNKNYIFVVTRWPVSKLLRSTDNGITFQIVKDSIGNTPSFYQYPFAENNKGDIYFGTSNNGIFKSIDDGISWTQFKFDSIPGLEILSICVDENDVIYSSFKDIGVFKSSDDGNSWISCNNGIINKQNIYPVISDLTGRLYSGSDGSGVFTSTNNGTSWENNLNGMDETVVQCFADNSKGNIFTGTSLSGVFMSSDKGYNWVIKNNNYDVTGGIYSIVRDDKDNLFIGTSEAGVLFSTDNGKTWQQTQSIFSGTPIMRLLFNSKKELWAATLYSVYKFDINNLSWEAKSFGLPYQQWLNDFTIDAGNNMYAGYSDVGLFKSSDEGVTWNRIADSLTTINVLKVRNGNYIFVSGSKKDSREVLEYSNDGGINWKEIQNGLDFSNGNYIRDFDFDNLGRIYCICVNNVYISSDDGTSWQTKNFGLDSCSLRSVFVSKNNYIYLGTSGYGIYKSKEIVNSATEILFDNIDQFSISPNPASDKISISFSNPESSNKSISIFNSLGIEVKRFDEKELTGQNTINISTEDFPPGIYFCTLNSGFNKIIKSFVVVR